MARRYPPLRARFRFGEQVVDAAPNWDYARRHKLAEVRIILHGGESLLAGVKRIVEFAELAYSLTPPGTQLRLSVQTNGTQLDDEMIDVLRRYRISVGVRLNGTEADNDRSRPYRDGSGSHSKVAEAPRRLNQPYNRRIYGGILCTIDLQNSPLITYRHLIEFRPPNLDFILPLGHWGEPPPGRDADPHNVPYAEWLFWGGARNFPSILASHHWAVLRGLSVEAPHHISVRPGGVSVSCRWPPRPGANRDCRFGLQLRQARREGGSHAHRARPRPAPASRALQGPSGPG